MHKRALLLTLGVFAVRPVRALYDPKPVALLELAAGAWVGSLTYRDYQKPDKMVTLQTAMTVSLAAPDELVLYFVFDDGPGTTVYSYERIKIDLASNRLVWNSGISKPHRSEFEITSSATLEERFSVHFEKTSDTGTDRHSLAITRSDWSLAKHEISVGGTESLRSRYAFTRRAT